MASNQRERMLAAVADAVAEKGYAALAVEDVVRLAGVSRRTFYDQFADKQEAFFAAYDASVEQTMVAIARPYASSSYWPEQIRLGVQGLLRFLTKDPAFARMGLVELPLAGPRGQARHVAARSGFEIFLAPGQQLARSVVPPLVPRTIVAGIYAAAYARVVRGRTRELPALLPAIVFHCVAPYAGLEVAREQSELARTTAWEL